MSCSFVFILRVCERLKPTISFCLLAMSKEREQGSSVSTVAVNDDSGTAISPSITRLIKAYVAESIGALTDGVTQVIEYLSDELASNSDDEKRMYRAERRAERKTKERRRRFRPADRKESASSTSTAFSSRSGSS